MRWETLTAPDFARAAEETGVCVLPMGVLEKHSDHLPLGNDVLSAHTVACAAAEREKAIVFPAFYYGQIYEARCFPGTLTIKPQLLFDLLEATCDDIARNGLKKIIILNWHGGNTQFLRYFTQCELWAKKDYQLYVLQGWGLENLREKIFETPAGHACEFETSIAMHAFGDFVRPECIPVEPAEPLGRFNHLPETFSGLSWYANYPDHYAGDARKASAEKGEKILGYLVDRMAKYIKMVKDDTKMAELKEEFFSKTQF